MPNFSSEELLSQVIGMGKLLKQKFNYNNPSPCISIAQIETLKHIKEKRQVLMKDLADFLNIAPPSVTALVDHLVKEKLVSRSLDRKDRRIIKLELTKKGQTQLAKAEQRRNRVFRQILQNLNFKEQATLLKILSKITQN